MSHMCKFILEFNNHSYIKNVSKEEINNSNYTIKDLFINTIDTIYRNEFNKNIYHNNYYFIKDRTLIHPDSSILNNTILKDSIVHNNTVTHIKCYRKQYGGFPGGGSIGNTITNSITSMFNPIFNPIEAIVTVFISIYKFLEWCGLFLYWCWFFAVWLFTDLLNPAHFIDDAFQTLQLIIMAIFSSIFHILMEVLRFSVNIIGEWTQGFWGWDQSSVSQTDRDSNYFKKMKHYSSKKCYLTNTNTIPFIIVLGTVLCPPVGVFMDMGLTGWFNIFICILLTLCFYLPGLIYALIIIYS